MKHSHAAAIALVCMLILQPCGRGFADAKGMTEVDAVHLLIAYLQSRGYDKGQYPLDIDKLTAAQGFYAYDVHAAGPHDYYGHIGLYAVNIETGDIWDTGLCRRLDTAAIAPLENLIRDNRELSRSEIERKKKPACLND